MNVLIFALLIIVTMYMRSQIEKFDIVAKNFQKESDYFKQREELTKVLWLMVVALGFVFWAPFVLMLSLNWLLGWSLTYWFTFALYLLWSQFLKIRRK